MIRKQGDLTSGGIDEREGSSPSGQANVFCEESTYYKVSLAVFEDCNVDALPPAFLAHFIALGLTEEEGFLLFPNPAKENLHVGMSSTTPRDVSMTLTDQNGLIQKHFSFNSTIGYNVFTLPLEALPSGVYSLKVSFDGSSHSQLFTIQ